VDEVMRGIRRAWKRPATQKAPAVDEEVRRMVDAVDRQTLKGLRDRALLLLGFAGALRRSELVADVGKDVPPVLYEPEPDVSKTHQMIVESCADETRKLDNGKSPLNAASFAAFAESGFSDFAAYRFCFRLWIWKRTLTSTYGAEFFEKVKAAVAGSKWPTATEPVLDKIDELYDKALSDDNRTSGLHNLLVAWWALDLIDRTKPTDVQDATVQRCADAFKHGLFHFSHYVRFLLSCLVHGERAADASLREDPLA
jgi:hypothetical protein